jgi:hypothetical protein
VIQLIVVGFTTWNWGSFAFAVLIGGLVGGMRVYNLQRIGPRLRQLEAQLSENDLHVRATNNRLG